MKFADICRLCLVKSSKTSDEIFFPIDQGFEIKFVEITNFALAKPSGDGERDKFPNKVCITCVTELEQHHNYR
jgi:hypothetical protein